MVIYKPDGQALMSIDVDDESYHYAEIMGRDDVTLYFSLPHYVEFPVGSYVTYMAKNYTLYSVDKMRMEHRRDFEYTITFESVAVQLENYIYSNPNDGRFKFPLTAKPGEHLSLLCRCLSDKTGVTWTAANQIDSTDKLISYDAMTCLDALKQIADTFETEYRIDGTTIYLGKVEFFTQLEQQIALSYGKGNGLRPGVEKVSDNAEKIIGRVYIQGGDRNIDYSQYGSSTLLLPKNTHIWYDGTTFYDSAHTGATDFVTSADGRYVSLNENNAPVAEGALDLTDVYPCYDHHVSAVEEVDVDNHWWDIYSDTFTAGTSTTTKVNYEDCLIENGQDMTIIFQSGALSGREFGVKWKTKEVTANNETTEVAYMEIVPSEQDGYTMPDRASGFYPKATDGGDIFRVFNIYLPNSYILSAEIEMLHQAVKYLYDNCRERFSIKGEVDPIWSASQWATIGGHFVPGAYFRFSDPVWAEDGVSIRITSVKTFINKPHMPIVELSNSVGGQGVSTALKRIEAEAKILPESVKKDSMSFTKRSFADAKETMSAIAEAMIEGFSDSISPITVQTMQAIVGDEGLQFRFWTDRTCVEAIQNPFTYDVEHKKLKWVACALQHMTLEIDDIRPSSSRPLSDYLRWNIAANESAVLDDPSKLYYVYAKCDKLNNGTNHLGGSIVLYDQALDLKKMEPTPSDGYYYFLCGILNSERDGSRSFAPLYGYTEILPGQITTDVIRNSTGNSFWDLTTGVMNIGDKLKYNVSGDGSLVLNGTLVQTGSGDTTPIGAWCGEYSSSTRYKKGDEVYYQDGDAIATYRYKSDTIHDPTVPSTVHPPTDSGYWEATSVGASGGSGQGVFKSIVFKRSDSTPSTPTGGSYLSPVPSGWSDGVPSGTEILWMSTRIFTSDGLSPQESNWTTPNKATSGDEMDYRWSASSSEPLPPDQDSGGSLAWTASSNKSWITLGSGSTSGTGSKTLTYSVAANTSTSSRTGTITISYSGGTKSFTITQAGTGTVTGSISPTTVSQFSASGGTQTFTITANSSWTLTKTDLAWVTLSSSSGSSNATVTATIPSNSGSSRSGTLTFTCGSSSVPITISQAASGGQTATMTPENVSVATGGGDYNIVVTVPSGMQYQLSRQDSYTDVITRIDGAVNLSTWFTGTGSPVTHVCTIAANNTGEARTRYLGLYVPDITGSGVYVTKTYFNQSA